MWLLDSNFFLFVFLPSLVIGMLAQGMVKGAISKYSHVPASSGLTGAQAAHEMLRAAGLDRRVGIERVSGFLSDHYDPRKKVLRLSPQIHDERSIAAIGVACHEAGHAVQDAKNYAPLVLRNAIVPTAGLGSNLGMILIVVGFFLNWTGLALVGLVLFGVVVVFQLVNLPVEFNASTRAKQMVTQLGLVHGPQETAGVSRVLNAAAMTYVAATITAILHLLYYAMLIFGRRD